MQVVLTNNKGAHIEMVSYDEQLSGGLKDYISEGDVILNHVSNRGGDAFAISTSIILNDGKLYSMGRKEDRVELKGLYILSSFAS